MRNNRLVSIVIGLQVLTLLSQWVGAPANLPAAQAQVTDPGRDRMQMIDGLRAIDTKLDKLIALLGSGDVQVKVVQADEARGHGAGR